MKRRGSGSKPSRTSDKVSVVYPTAHWARLDSLRDRAVHVINALTAWSQTALTHGSVARGDVDDKSDVDVLIPSNVNTQIVEAALENAGFTIFSREIAQATPSHSPKAHLHLDPEQTTSVPGCTKKLLLIEPIPEGHFESPVVGRESEVARLLGVSVAIVVERVRVLTRRDIVGRTGMYLRIPVREGESFDEVLRTRSDSDPALRRTLRGRS